MPKKSRKPKSLRRPHHTFDKGVKHFSEEVGALGKKAGEKGEALGNKFGKNTGWCCGCGRGPFGAIGLVLSIIIGVLGLALSIWALDFLARKTGSATLSALHVFLLANTGVFILIFLLSALLTYISRCCRSGYVLASPISAAFSITVFFWIAASIMAIANIGIGNLAVYMIADFVRNNLFAIFWIFLVLGYFAMLLKLLSGKLSGECRATGTEPAAHTKSTAAKPGAPRRLYRSGKEKIIAGVCGGIAEYLGVDPVLIRLIWVAFALAGGSGILLYIIAWIIIPRNPNHKWN